MEKLGLGTAKKILRLIDGDIIPYSQLKNKLINQMLSDGLLQVQLHGRSRKLIFTSKPSAVVNFLDSHLGIGDLNDYILNLEQGGTRAENVVASGNSKLKSVRTFKGFLVNCYSPISASINGVPFTVSPKEGTYTYIHDFENFVIPPDTLIVGIENPENFRYIRQQMDLFDDKSILFVSRYPQSNDLITWLIRLPNKYLHFGDFDFEGIRIFRDEYHKHLKENASFFIPPSIKELLEKYGNKNLYDLQYKTDASESLAINEDIEALISLFHKYKRCLEQEVLIKVKG